MQQDSRTKNVIKNVIYNYTGNIITSILAIICRTIFIYKLGVEYLGVSGLFANILGVLSFSELGIGTAINYALYKPVAKGDKNKILALLSLYKKAYRIIALVVSAIGLAFIPFMKYLLNTDIELNEIYIFYLIFLFNTVSSYFVNHKTTYVYAIQKNYILTNIYTISVVITNIIQIALLIVGGGYVHYLLCAAIIELLQKIIMVKFLNKKYPILTEKNNEKLLTSEKKEIWKNVRALIVHKIGDISVHQSDNIIISAFISTATVGKISNYTTISGMVATFTNGFFNSFTSSIGNLIAKENEERQYEVFREYDLLGFWVFGFVFIAFTTLTQSFITIWIGHKMLVDGYTMFLYFFSAYLASMTLIPYNFKVAAGKFDEDKWVAFAQAIVNIVVSIWAIKIIGLPGVYVGTIVQRLIVVIVRPYIVYKHVFKRNVLEYYKSSIVRVIILLIVFAIMSIIKQKVLVRISIIRFMLMMILTVIIPNICFYIIYGNTELFKNIISRLKRRKN